MNTPTITPFFIVGAGRSGTTLLRTLLNRHPKLCIPPESLFVIDYLRSCRTVSLKEIKKLILSEYELREWNIRPTFDEISSCANISEIIDKFNALYCAKSGVRWGGKTPRFVRHLELLDAHFTGAQYIHVIRDPRAVVASLVKAPAHASTAFHGALRWTLDVSAGLRFEELNPNRVLRVKYETLVTDTATELDRICKFLGIAGNIDIAGEMDATLEQYDKAYFRAFHANLWRPVSQEPVNAWQNALSPCEVATIEAECRSLMDMLSYERRSATSSMPIWISRFKRIAGIVRQLSHYSRYRTGYLPSVLYRKIKLGLLLEDLRQIVALNR